MLTPELIVVSNAADAASWLPGVPAIPDTRPERGSLVGLHTALTHAAGDMLVVAWDMPFVSADLLRLIHDHRRAGTCAVVPEGPAGPEPLCALYTPSALPPVTAAIDAGNLRFTDMLASLPSYERIPLGAVLALGEPARLFFNVNTPDDLAEAERMAAHS